MKIGDRVSVIDDDLRGEIISLSGSVAVLADEHGFHHRFSLEKLVPQGGDLYAFTHVEPKAEPKKIISKKNAGNTYVLDLHFEKLADRKKKYDSAERLFLQKQKLIDALDFCRKAGIKRMEIIHGVGDGVLQEMVCSVLSAQAGIDFHDKEILHHQSGAVVAYLL